MPITQAEALVKALKGAGTPVWYVRFEDAGHQQLTVPTNDFSFYTWALFVQKIPTELRKRRNARRNAGNARKRSGNGPRLRTFPVPPSVSGVS